MEEYLIIDSIFYRPAEVDVLLGNLGKAGAASDWLPEIDQRTMIVEMVDADLERLRRHRGRD